MGITLSYLPAMLYYQYHTRHYNVFISEISERYSDRIRDDHLEKFKDNQNKLNEAHKKKKWLGGVEK